MATTIKFSHGAFKMGRKTIARWNDCFGELAFRDGSSFEDVRNFDQADRLVRDWLLRQ
jgi:hypothetical protein